MELEAGAGGKFSSVFLQIIRKDNAERLRKAWSRL